MVLEDRDGPLPSARVHNGREPLNLGLTPEPRTPRIRMTPSRQRSASDVDAQPRKMARCLGTIDESPFFVSV